MSRISTVKFTGKSGVAYPFDVYPFDMLWDDGIAGVYFVSNRHKNKLKKNIHQSLLIGETGDIQSIFPDHPKRDKLRKLKANMICVYRKSNHEDRKKIAADLVAAYSPPCNG
ncbi:hypothetical protein KS4_16610 [Poriferisphaera corsica]|uniref:Uncharacterized protein n=1 Tax=Poriferisphaera corsica TaxID=2528020 RepID=A0A517YTS4_9BACT|nr:hypothetical protein [Poriferisphaera corsica]QDU33609.1 hypothetical protein KS4_16610 [Poriferisphaera corsica]